MKRVASLTFTWIPPITSELLLLRIRVNKPLSAWQGVKDNEPNDILYRLGSSS